MTITLRAIWLCTALGACLPWAIAHAADQVEIFRCKVDGRTVTQDKPCKPGQEVSRQNMTRPRDPAKPAVLPTTQVPAQPPQQITYVIQNGASASRPIYQCTSPDGERYTSESADGIARWVPAYGTTYSVLGTPRPPAYSGGGAWVNYADRHTSVQIGGGYARPPVMYPPVYIGGGLWVRDTCVAMPRAQSCALLDARRAEIRRKNVALQASDRDALDAEAASIDARLRADCNR